jgi:hypothetical protein
MGLAAHSACADRISLAGFESSQATDHEPGRSWQKERKYWSGCLLQRREQPSMDGDLWSPINVESKEINQVADYQPLRFLIQRFPPQSA